MIKKNPILFLDIDGVLNSPMSKQTQFINSWKELLDPLNIIWLNKIVEQTNCDIVISSAWRKFMDNDELKVLLINKGFEFSDKIIGQTPINVEMYGLIEIERPKEIFDWLRDNSDKEQTFAVVDDEPLGERIHNFVQTDDLYGLREDDADRLIEMLRG